MTKQDKITATHENVFMALCAAQMEYEPLRKTAKNEAFKRDGKASRYADLAGVVEAVGPALNRHGIAHYHTIEVVDGKQFMTAVLHHGASGTELRCPVELRVDRDNIHGYKSATTYAKRIGLESVSGIAPEDDDDGNAAAQAVPKQAQTVTPDQYIKLRDKAQEADVPEEKLCSAYGCNDLQQFPADKLASAMKKLQATIDAKKPDDMDGDAIPQFEGETA